MAMALAIPAIVFAGYYLKIFNEPIWLYRLRAVEGSELLAALAGFSAGWAQASLRPRTRIIAIIPRVLIPTMLGVVLAVPYLKPLISPLTVADLRDNWRDDVCLQSSASTCGPASAATLLRYFGRTGSEPELA